MQLEWKQNFGDWYVPGTSLYVKPGHHRGWFFWKTLSGHPCFWSDDLRHCSGEANSADAAKLAAEANYFERVACSETEAAV